MEGERGRGDEYARGSTESTVKGGLHLINVFRD
jgi:hypothetical protein